jgi:hypothetical protein
LTTAESSPATPATVRRYPPKVWAYLPVMDLTARVQALTAADLMVVVRRVLRDDASELLGWTAESPDWTALVAKGIYLLRGSARLGSGEETSWAVVLKVVEDDGSPAVHDIDGVAFGAGRRWH